MKLLLQQTVSKSLSFFLLDCKIELQRHLK